MGLGSRVGKKGVMNSKKILFFLFFKIRSRVSDFFFNQRGEKKLGKFVGLGFENFVEAKGRFRKFSSDTNLM